jgi:hypothetical protein
MGLGSTPEDARHVFAFCRNGRGNEDAGLHDLKVELRCRLGPNVSEWAGGGIEGLGFVAGSASGQIMDDLARRVEALLEEARREFGIADLPWGVP